MALIKCKECGKEISNKADACPHCGFKQPKAPGFASFLRIMFLVVIAIVMLPFMVMCMSSRTDQPLKASSSSPSAPSAQTVSTPTPKLPGSQWFYHQHDDKMGKGVVYQAYVLSSNTVEFGFPYSGTQHATLALRTHPRNGKDIIFRIEKGQILCHSYEDCTVLVRFDDDPPTNYSAVGAADNSTETIFIRNYDRFIGKVLKAKRVRISVNIYQQGAPAFEFDVSSFDQEKYRPKK